MTREKKTEWMGQEAHAMPILHPVMTLNPRWVMVLVGSVVGGGLSGGAKLLSLIE